MIEKSIFKDGANKNLTHPKLQKGITLIALIITIIVLLILAVVAINAVNDGGIIQHAKNAKEEYAKAQEKENVNLATNQAFLIGKGKITEENLTSALNSEFGAKDSKWKYLETTEEYFKIRIIDSGREYIIYTNGKVEGPGGGGGSEPPIVDPDPPVVGEELTVVKEYNGDSNTVNLKLFPNLSDATIIEIVSELEYKDYGIDTISTLNDAIKVVIAKEASNTMGTTITYDQFLARYEDEISGKTLTEQFVFMTQMTNLEVETIQEWAAINYNLITEPNTEPNVELKINGTTITEGLSINGVHVEYTIVENGEYNIELKITEKESEKTYSSQITVEEVITFMLNVKQSYNEINDEVKLKIVPAISDSATVYLAPLILEDNSIKTKDDATTKIIERVMDTTYDTFKETYKDQIAGMTLEEQFAFVMEEQEIKEAYGIETINEFVTLNLIMEATSVQCKIDGKDVGDKNNYPFEYIATENRTYDIELIIDGRSYSENVTVSDIDGNIIRIGETIEYSAGEVNDWKVFYKNDNYVYIITSDYLNNSLLPEGLNMSTSGTYIANWEGSDNFTSQNGATDITAEVAEKFMLNWWNENRENTKKGTRAVADLLNSQIWTSSFGDTDRAIEAIGAPTIDMWAASWNMKGYGELGISFDEKGYYTSSTSTGNKNLSSTGYNDKLYFPYKEIVDNCYGYWLASPMTTTIYGDAGLESIRTEGAIYVVDWGWKMAARPVVAVPINLVERNANQKLVVK